MKLKNEALVEFGHFLKRLDYQFTTITPNSHHSILKRDGPTYGENSEGESLRQLFGWNKKVRAKNFSTETLENFQKAGVADVGWDFVKARVRFSSYQGQIFMHSPFPTEENDSVFFGPDTYRFISFCEKKIQSAKSIADIGAGSGAGALALAAFLERSGQAHPSIYLTDINDQALRFSQVNAGIMGHQNVQYLKSDLLQNLPRGCDTIIANPPFIIDSKKRAYRHGGENYGAEISVNILKQSLEYLEPGGQLALYTGACVVNGKDMLWHALSEYLAFEDFTYEEIDPDIFGEELLLPEYKDVERIAAVGLYLKV